MFETPAQITPLRFLREYAERAAVFFVPSLVVFAAAPSMNEDGQKFVFDVFNSANMPHIVGLLISLSVMALLLHLMMYSADPNKRLSHRLIVRPATAAFDSAAYLSGAYLAIAIAAHRAWLNEQWTQLASLGFVATLGAAALSAFLFRFFWSMAPQPKPTGSSRLMYGCMFLAGLAFALWHIRKLYAP